MMDLEIWLDLAVGIIALLAIGLGVWVYFSSEKGKEISLPFLNNLSPSSSPKKKKSSPPKISQSLNRLLGREDNSTPSYALPEEEPLTVPIRSTTLPSDRKVPPLEELYNRAKAFDQEEEEETQPEEQNSGIFSALSPQTSEPVSLPENYQEEATHEEIPATEPLLTQRILDRINGSSNEDLTEEPLTEEAQAPVHEEPAVVTLEPVVPPVAEVTSAPEVETEEKQEEKIAPPLPETRKPTLEPQQVVEPLRVTPPKKPEFTKAEQPTGNVSGLPTLQGAESGVPFSFAQFLLLIQTNVQKTVAQAKEKISQVKDSARTSTRIKPKPAAEYEAGNKKVSGFKGKMQSLFQSVTSIFQRGVEKVQEKTDIPGRVKGEDDLVEIATQTTRNGRTPYLNFFKIDEIPVKENSILLGLQNIGWTLHYEHFEIEEHNQVKLKYKAPQRYSTSPATYPQGSLICFEIDNQGKKDFAYHFKVFFEDRGGTSYFQEIYGQGVVPPIIKDPEILQGEEAVAEGVS
ncbi:MAG: hypothetical protein AAF655_17625 [Bacteroidota bacterium]